MQRTPAQLPLKRVAWRVASFAVGAFVVVVATLAGVRAWSLNQGFQFQTIPSALPTLAPAPPGGPGPQNILLLGVDGGPAGPRATPDPAAHLDALSNVMLVHVPGDRLSVQVVSLQPGMHLGGPTSPTLGDALRSGGVKNAVAAAENLLGTDIDHVAVIDDQAYAVVADSLGGADLSVTTGFATEAGGTVAAGPQHFDGAQAREYLHPDARLPGAPELAVHNQQQLIEAMLAKAVKGDLLTNLRLLADLSSKATPYVAVDQTLTPEYLVGLGLKLGDIRHDVTFEALPARGAGAQTGETDAVPPLVVDGGALHALQHALASDTVGEYRP